VNTGVLPGRIGRSDLEHDLRRVRLSASAIMIGGKAGDMVPADIRATARMPA
jgi:hypothetical protein